jgi:multidrug efflux pump subunit AcrA (membrane-fusion protein)
MIPAEGPVARVRARVRAGYTLAVLAAFAVVFWARRPATRPYEPAPATTPRMFVAERRTFVRTVRLHGVLAATEAQLVMAPQINSPDMGTLRIAAIAAAGSRVKKGDLLVQFDRQTQQRNVLDRRAEYEDALQQIRRRQADEDAELAASRTELRRAETAVQLMKLDLRRNEALPRIEAEKNEQMAEEAAARLAQTRRSQDQRRRILAAEMRTLQSRAEAAQAHLRYAEEELTRLTVSAPMDGIVLMIPVWRDAYRELGPGDETHPGEAFLKIVDPVALEVRAAVNQADVGLLALGQKTETRLDAYPDLRLAGRVLELAPIATGGGRIRTFEARIALEAKDARLLPDLTAAVDVELERVPDAVILPREAVAVRDGASFVRIPGLLGPTERAIRVRATGDCEIAVESGVEPGERVLRTEGDA